MAAKSKDELVVKLAPDLISYLQGRKQSIVENAGGFLERQAVNLGWNTMINEVPNILDTCIEMISKEFGSMNVNDLLDFLSEFSESK